MNISGETTLLRKPSVAEINGKINFVKLNVNGKSPPPSMTFFEVRSCPATKGEKAGH